MMNETGVGIINPMFFIGVIEDVFDPRLEKRVKVRAFGIHGTVDQIPTADLPWATLVVGSHDVNFVIPPINSWVFGFFVDGRDAQQPMILGLIPTQFVEPINPAVTGWGAITGNEVDLAAHKSTVNDVGQPTNSPLERGEYLQNTYIASVETNRVRNIPVAGGTSASFSPKGNMGVASQDESTQSSAAPSNIPTGPLKDDKEFQAVLSEMKAKYPGLTDGEIYRVIQGESAFNPRAVNSSTGAAGLFQFIPKVASELGTSPSAIVNLSPADQLRLYDRYLQRWNYKGGSLGIMQAAPSKANLSGGSVVYEVGSRAWELNPGWRTSGNGPITVDSINAYYSGRPAPSNPSYNTSAANVSSGNSPSSAAPTGTFWEEPTVGYNAKYPYNRVIETAGGHSVELDDTPGSERIMIYHKSGSYIQLTNSSSTYKSMEDAYNIYEDNFMVYVGGNHMVTIEGDCHVLVKGNKVEEIMGDYRQIIHGNHSVGIAGQGNFNASEEIQMRAARLGFEANVENINFNAAKQIKGTSVEQIHFKTKNMFAETSEGMNFKTGTQIFIGAGESINVKTGEELKIMATGKVSLNTEASVEIKSTGKTNIDATGAVNIKSGTTISLESVGTTNIKNQMTKIESSNVMDLKAGGNLRMQGAAVYIDGSTVFIDDFVSMANGANNPPGGAAAADAAAPSEPEEVTAAQPATEVKLGEPPSKELPASPVSGPR
jgi:hypothetical protein